MNSWRGRKICVLRAGTAVYWAPDPDSDSCESKKDTDGNKIEFIKCGTGNAAVCQEKNLGCPVNRVKLVKSSEPKPSDMSNFVFLGDDYKLYFGYANSSSVEGPIIDFAISEGDRCLQDPGDVDNDDKEIYKLGKSQPDECKYVDERFIRVDSMDEVTFYKYNNLQNVSTLPGLVLNEKVKYHLSFRSSILWKTVCHKNYYSRKTLHDNRRPFSYLYGLHLAVLIVETIFAAYLVIADPIMLYFCYKKAEEEINEYDQPIYTILIVEKFLKIILVPLVLTTCIVVAYYRNWFYNLEERCCSDPTTNACFGFVDYILDDLYGLDWANFSVIVTVLIVDLISGLCLFVSRTKENFS
jgi:hypothetical protein